MIPRFAFGLGYLILLVAVGLVALGVHFMSGTVPAYSGGAKVSGISGTIDIDRDDYAIPHIHATTERDAYYGLGYAEAQDRLFQMELERRLGEGRMSELFGSKTLPLDRWSRTIGFSRIADQMWLKAGLHTRDVLTAFVAGINAYLADHKTHLGFTFDALRLVPEPWRPQDCMTIGRLMSWEMNFSALADAAFGDFSLTLDSAHLRSLFPYYPDDGATVLGGANRAMFVSNYLAAPPQVPKSIARPAIISTPVVSPTPVPLSSSVPKTPARPFAKPLAKTQSKTTQTKQQNSKNTPQSQPQKPGVKAPKPTIPKPLHRLGSRMEDGTEFANIFETAHVFDSAVGAAMGGGSNAIAVSGSHSVEGGALLENDTHLQLESPSRWYLAHLVSDDGINVAGFLIPGLPVILSGRTEDLSWGITNGMADECDYFIETLDSTGTKYLLPNRVPKNFISFTDTIRVRDSESVSEASNEMLYEPSRLHAMTKVPITIRMTIHGPILTGMHPDRISQTFNGDMRAGGVPDSSIFSRVERPLAMMWNGEYALGDEIAGFLALPHAHSIVEARTGMKDFATPCLNLCIADAKGNISYQYIGRLPRREGSEARQLLPRDGSNPSDQWMRFESTSELFSTFNPSRGYIASANNPPSVSDPRSSTSIPLGLNWEPSSRADRIGELLEERARVDETYLQSIQTDIISPYDVRRVLPYLLALYPDPNPPKISADSSSAIRLDSMEIVWKEDSLFHHTTITDSAIAQMRQKDSAILASHRPRVDTSIHFVKVDAFTAQVLSYLRNWDGGMRAEEIAPTIYSVFVNRLLFNTFRDGLGSDAHCNEFLALQNIPLVTLANLLPDSGNIWWHSRIGNWGRDSVIQLSFRESLRILAQLFGPDIRNWQWGKLHTLTFRHPFDKAGKTIARLVDVSAGAMPGGSTTVLQASYFLWNPYEMQVGPSMRMIANMKNDILLAVLPTGNSEAMFGDHYRDMLPLYQSGALIRLDLHATYQSGKNWKRFELNPNGT